MCRLYVAIKVFFWCLHFIHTDRTFINCGGRSSAKRGLITSPDFPSHFPVPIRCQWILEAPQNLEGRPLIVLYMTQFYLREGVTMDSYASYSDESLYVGHEHLESLTSSPNQDVVKVRAPILVITLELPYNDNVSFRSSPDFLDVWGFNITYEIVSEELGPRIDSCSVYGCSLTGQCYVSDNYYKFFCDCVHGFYGESCEFGPDCNPALSINFCENGGSCRYRTGADMVHCDCPEGYSGNICEFKTALANSSVKEDCENMEEDSNHRCKSSGVSRFFFSIKLSGLYVDPLGVSNTSADYINLKSNISSQVYDLISVNLTTIRNFSLSGFRPGAIADFWFLADEAESETARKVITRELPKQLSEDILVDDNYMLFDREPTLNIQGITIEGQQPLREGFPCNLTCKAQGSSDIRFKWFKDGAVVNPQIAVRSIKVSSYTKNALDQYTSVLHISKLSAEDEGLFACEANDLGFHQKTLVHMKVVAKPNVFTQPRAATIFAGQNLTLLCKSSETGPRNYKFNWEKNGNLIQNIEDEVVVEDLYPTGIRLFIANATESGAYVCVATSLAGISTAVSKVVVAMNDKVAVCPEDGQWPSTAAGSNAYLKCPEPYRGHMSRTCAPVHDKDSKEGAWEESSYALCYTQPIMQLQKQLRSYELGYQETNLEQIIVDLLDYLNETDIRQYMEGEAIVDLLYEVLLQMEDQLSLDVTSVLQKIINYMFSKPKILSLPSYLMLHNLLRAVLLKQTHGNSSLIAMEEDYYLGYSIKVLDNVKIIIPPPQHQRPPWVHESLRMWMTTDTEADLEVSESRPQIAAIIYRNMSSLLPSRFVLRSRYQRDEEYEMFTEVTAVYRHHYYVITDPYIELVYEVSIDLEETEHNFTCSKVNLEGSFPSWKVNACQTVKENYTFTCICDSFGAYAVLRSSKPQVTPKPVVGVDIEVLMGSGGCLLLLLCSAVYLVVRVYLYCDALNGVYLFHCSMLILITALSLVHTLYSLSQDSLTLLSFLAELCFLSALGCHFSVVLLVYSDTVIIEPPISHLRFKIFILPVGLATVITTSTMAAHTMLDKPLQSWWLSYGSEFFYATLISAGILLPCYLILHCYCWWQLKKWSDLYSTSCVSSRLVSLHQSLLLLLCTLLFVACGSFHLNKATPLHRHLFTSAFVIQGAAFLFCHLSKQEREIRRIYRNFINITSNFIGNQTTDARMEQEDLYHDDDDIKLNQVRGKTEVPESESPLIKTNAIIEDAKSYFVPEDIDNIDPITPV